MTESSMERDEERGRRKPHTPLEEQANQEGTTRGSLLRRPRISIPRLPSTFLKSKGKLKEQTQQQRAHENRNAATNKKFSLQDRVKNILAKNNNFFWPQNIPEVCTRARVMTFGYDSDVTKFSGGGANQNTFYDHAGDLLGALVSKRTDAVCTMTSCYNSTHSLVGTAR